MVVGRIVCNDTPYWRCGIREVSMTKTEVLTAIAKAQIAASELFLAGKTMHADYVTRSSALAELSWSAGHFYKFEGGIDNPSPYITDEERNDKN